MCRQFVKSLTLFVFLGYAFVALSGCAASASSDAARILVSVMVAPQKTTVAQGSTLQFSATGKFSDGSTKDLTDSVSWSSSNSGQASIETSSGSNPGLASGIATGAVTITASAGGVNGSALLTVSNNTRTLTSVTVAPQVTSLVEGSTEEFTATGKFSDGSTSDLTETASWSSSNSSLASIQTSTGSDPGLASAIGPGTVTISATSGSVKGAAQLTVTGGGTGSSITLNPASLTLAVNAKQQFDAILHLSSGTTQDVTTAAVWTSSSNSATVETVGASQPGLATGASSGTATITVSYQGVTGTAVLTVTDTLGGTSLIPIMDITASQNYLNSQGGLYENSSNTVPADHDADGKAATAAIQPLDTNGVPSSTGTVIFVSFGMSNALIEFASFLDTATHSPSVNQTTLHIANGAMGEQDACYWFPAVGPPSCNSGFENEYDRIEGGLSTVGLSAAQVQVAWVDNANGRVHSENRGCLPFGTLCLPLCDPTITGCANTVNTTNPLNEEEEFAEMLRAAKQRFPNLKMLFFSSRVYGGYQQPTNADPEPFAYQTGYGIKAAIQAQINQVRTGIVDPVAGDLSYSAAPWIGWGPYFWANGDVPRSDGLVWCLGQTSAPCNGEVDFGPDGLHLSTAGGQKAANLLLNFFLTSPYTAPWFAAAK